MFCLGELNYHRVESEIFVPTPLKFNMEAENPPLFQQIPDLETIIIRFHVQLRRVELN